MRRPPSRAGAGVVALRFITRVFALWHRTALAGEGSKCNRASSNLDRVGKADSDVQRIVAALARRTRAFLGLGSRAPRGAGEDVAPAALADWQRYAAELERALEAAAPVPVIGTAIRQEIVVAAGEAAGENGRPGAGFALGAGPSSGPLVTVVIPVYNDVEMTRACLESLAEHPPAVARVEYVVVDDASHAWTSRRSSRASRA